MTEKLHPDAAASHPAAIVETLLFIHGEPLSRTKIAKVSGLSQEEISAALIDLRRLYQDRGLAILEKDDAICLGTNPAYHKLAEELLRSEFSESLSRAALETLAVIAYKGPIGRATIDFIRGVNSSFIIRTLAMRGLIERSENPADARAHFWRVSFDFLKHLGITRLDELPSYETLRKEQIEIPEEKMPDAV